MGEKDEEEKLERTLGQTRARVAGFMVQRFDPLSHGAPEIAIHFTYCKCCD